MIDVHAHLTDASFSGDLPRVLERARAAGVRKIVTSITDPGELAKALQVVESSPGYVYLTVGFDPSSLSAEKYSEFSGIVYRHRASLLGIGEVGLDHFYIRDHSERAIQEGFFRASIRLAKSLDLPLVVHSRSAGRRALEVLLSEGVERVLMHAFDGRASDALAAAKSGYLFSIPASVVFSVQKQKLAKALPLESIALETDSPVLSPVRGERNEPANVMESARAISGIKKLALEEVIEATTANARRLFRF